MHFARLQTAWALLFVFGCQPLATPTPVAPIAGTGQRACYDETKEIDCSQVGAFAGQDATNGSPALAYESSDGETVTDLVTGLTWTKAALPPQTFDEAVASATTFRAGGASDWRLPTIHELFSLMDFSGHFGTSAQTSRPFIDTSAFDFAYASDGTNVGERFIDVQVWSSSQYTRPTGPSSDPAVFGVNFADGRIKAYPTFEPGSGGSRPLRMRVRYVRGPSLERHHFIERGDVVADESTGLEWQRNDDGVGRTWAEALAWCRDLSLGGHDDWGLPDAKQLYSLVDVSRVPAIDPVFGSSAPDGYGWTSTTLLDGPDDVAPSKAVYIAFGPALGWFEVPPGSQQWRLFDIHGAGAQRADPKRGDPTAFPHGFGPQGDDVRIKNQVRCVRRAGAR